MNIRPMLIYSFVVVGLMLGLSAWAWTQLPRRRLDPHPLGGRRAARRLRLRRRSGCSCSRAITALIAALLAVIPRFEPRRANLERSGHGLSRHLDRGRHPDGRGPCRGDRPARSAPRSTSPASCCIGVGALFVVIGNYLPKVRSNYLIGDPDAVDADERPLVAEDASPRRPAVRARGPRADRARSDRRGRRSGWRVLIVAGDRGPAGRGVRLLVPGLEGRSGEAHRHERRPRCSCCCSRSSRSRSGCSIFALRDLLRPERTVRGDSKLMWGLIICFISLIGPILYFTVGREER